MALTTQEIIFIVLLVVLLFGATSIPKIARAMGRAQGEFNKAKRDFAAEMKASEGSAAASGPDEQQVRKTARELGIDESGKSLDEVKRLIQQRLA
jgi:sec-independent protein translocase protein TatA